MRATFEGLSALGVGGDDLVTTAVAAELNIEGVARDAVREVRARDLDETATFNLARDVVLQTVFFRDVVTESGGGSEVPVAAFFVKELAARLAYTPLQRGRLAGGIAREMDWVSARRAGLAAKVMSDKLGRADRFLFAQAFCAGAQYGLPALGDFTVGYAEALGLCNAPEIATLVTMVAARDGEHLTDGNRFLLAGRVSPLVGKGESSPDRKAGARVDYATNLIQAWGLTRPEQRTNLLELARQVSHDLTISEAVLFANNLGEQFALGDDSLYTLFEAVAEWFTAMMRRFFLIDLIAARRSQPEEILQISLHLIKGLDFNASKPSLNIVEFFPAFQAALRNRADKNIVFAGLIRARNMTPFDAARMVLAGGGTFHQDVVYFAEQLRSEFSGEKLQLEFLKALWNRCGHRDIQQALERRFGRENFPGAQA
jgi:hypothetical protein